MSHSAACHLSSSMRLRGRILLACTIAALSPRFRALSRKTELSTARAAGRRPKLMFERPSRMPQFGRASWIIRIPSSVSRPRRRSSSLPVAIVNVSGSMSRSRSSKPHFSTKRRWMRSAISSLRMAVLAMPACWSSSIVRATHAAPYRCSSGQTSSRRFSPSSRLIELTTHLPPARCRAASRTSASVESIISGTLTCRT